jgi:hypothetical protein
MTTTWRRRNTTSLLCWFLPTSGSLGLLEEKPKFALGVCTKIAHVGVKPGHLLDLGLRPLGLLTASATQPLLKSP